jgi:hypothetical protein
MMTVDKNRFAAKESFLISKAAGKLAVVVCGSGDANQQLWKSV